MEPSKLILKCIKAIESFDNNGSSTVDVHITRFLGKSNEGVSSRTSTSNAAEELISGGSRRYASSSMLFDDPDDIMVQQVFYGVKRFEKALSVFLNAMYHLNASVLNRQDYILFQVLSYLILFRLPELGMKKMGVLLDSQEPAKMHTLLSFAFDAEKLKEWVVQGWCKFLDRGFVEQLLAALDRLRPDATAWLDSRYTKAFGHSQIIQLNSNTANNGGALSSTSLSKNIPPPPSGVTIVPRKALTVPVAPNITKPTPRIIPEPIRIPQSFSMNPVPDWIENTSLEEIEEINKKLKEDNKIKTLAKYNFEKTVPKLHETKSTVEQLRAEVEAQRKLEHEPIFRARPPPPLPLTGADVKLNAAAILREEATLTAKISKEAAIIRDFEGNLRDTTEYYAWQEQERKRDEEARLLAVAMRKKEAEEATVAIKVSAAIKEEQAKMIVQDMKAINAIVLKHVALEKDVEIKVKQKIVDQVKTTEFLKPAIARSSVIEKRKKKHDRVRESSIAAETKLAKEREIEAAEKAEVLRKIRAIERVPEVSIKSFDPNTTSEVGLLSEMSLVEMNDRLAILRRNEAVQVADKRRDILMEKREKEELMLARVRNIQRVRERMSGINRETRNEKKEKSIAEREAAEAAREEKLLILNQKLIQKRAERENERREMAEDNARKAKAAMFLGGQAAETEAARLESRLLGMELRAQHDKEILLDAQERVSGVKVAEARAAEVRFAEAKAKRDTLEKTKKLELMAKSKEENEFRLIDTARRKHMFFEAADREMAVLDMRDSINEYAATRRHRDEDHARSLRGGVPRDFEKQTTLERRMARLPEGNPLSLTMQMRLTQGSVANAEKERQRTAALLVEKERKDVQSLA
jgi:hypothetical protein